VGEGLSWAGLIPVFTGVWWLTTCAAVALFISHTCVTVTGTHAHEDDYDPPSCSKPPSEYWLHASQGKGESGILVG
jgi:hypothetical protein